MADKTDGRKNNGHAGIKNGVRRFGNKTHFAAIEYYVWFEHGIGGKTFPEIREITGLSLVTLQRYFHKVQAVMQSEFEIEKAREVTFKTNVYQALDNLSWLLQQRNERITIEFLKGLGLFQAYVNNRAETLAASPAELRERIARKSVALGLGAGHDRVIADRIAQAASGDDLPSQQSQ